MPPSRSRALPTTRTVLALVVGTMLACPLSTRAGVSLRTADRTPHAEGRWVAVFKEAASAAARADHIARHRAIADSDPESHFHRTFKINGFEGYAAKFSNAHLKAAMQEDDLLEYIEVDGEVRLTAPLPAEVVEAPSRSAAANATGAAKNEQGAGASGCTTQDGAVWGLARVSQQQHKNNNKFVYSNAGANVDAYILDTGIYVGHNDFGGRAAWGTSFVGESTDNNGHGTHCAGTIGGSTYGVAKEARLVSVQVLTGTGSGSMSGVIAGLEWVCEQHSSRKQSGNKCVINLSLSGGRYNAMDQAANAAAQCGCAVVAAAGNDGADACGSSPAAAEQVITVGATTSSDSRPYFSNYGSCVDLFAPGVYIKSTWIGSQYALNAISGTSMAAPHVAGVAALYLSSGSSTAESVKSDLTNSATSGPLSNVGNGSPNLLVYSKGCDS